MGQPWAKYLIYMNFSRSSQVSTISWVGSWAPCKQMPRQCQECKRFRGRSPVKGKVEGSRMGRGCCGDNGEVIQSPPAQWGGSRAQMTLGVHHGVEVAWPESYCLTQPLANREQCDHSPVSWGGPWRLSVKQLYSSLHSTAYHSAVIPLVQVMPGLGGSVKELTCRCLVRSSRA